MQEAAIHDSVGPSLSPVHFGPATMMFNGRDDMTTWV
jgi:hypothetical protein